MLNLDKKINSSLPDDEKILTFKKRNIDLAKHLSKRSEHCWFNECSHATPQYSNRFIMKSLKSVGFIL